jgi:CyaY protein
VEAGKASGPFCPHADRDIAATNAAATLIRIVTVLMPSILEAALQAMPQATPLSDADYHRLAGEVLAKIEAKIDRWLQDDVIDIDTHRTGGLLELAFPDGSKVVVNAQPPLHELWLAARGGGYHFKHMGDAWRDTKDGVEFYERLSREASAQGGQALDFSS